MEILLSIVGFAICTMLLSKSMSLTGQPLFIAYISMGIILRLLYNVELAPEIMSITSETIMVFLLFIVGLELDLEHLKKTWALILSILIIQIIIITCLMIGFNALYELSFPIVFAYGSNLLLSSTAIVINILATLSLSKNKIGSAVLSMLIVQDLSIVPIVVVIESLNSNVSSMVILYKILLAVLILYMCAYGLGEVKKRGIMLEYKAFFKKPEIMLVSIITVCVIAIICAEKISLSASYGAFVLGLILGHLYDKHAFLDTVLSMHEVSMMLFFFMIGMRVSISYVTSNFIGLMVLTLGVLIIKMVMHFVSFNMVGVNARSSILIAALLSQLSEFSFVLIEKMSLYQIIPAHTAECLMNLTILSMIVGAVFPVIIYNIVGVQPDKHNSKTYHAIK